MLERLGYSVTAETEGLKALRTFSEEPDRFDLALLDHGMADVTGLEITQRMRRIRPRFSGRRLYGILVTHLRLNN
jgi:CheY-like chemotaxis protein